MKILLGILLAVNIWPGFIPANNSPFYPVCRVDSQTVRFTLAKMESTPMSFTVYRGHIPVLTVSYPAQPNGFFRAYAKISDISRYQTILRVPKPQYTIRVSQTPYPVYIKGPYDEAPYCMNI